MEELTPVVTIADVMHRFADDYIKENYLDPNELKLIYDIKACKTKALGSHVTACSACGQVKVHYNSCANRACPNCQGINKEKWILERQYDLLPVKHFHVVFTIPAELRSLCYQNQKVVYNLLFKCAWQTLDDFSKDPQQQLQARMGMISVLHTWTQQLLYHPHIHCLVPAGGITGDGKWKNTKNKGKFLFHVKALAKTFRGKMMEQLIKLYKTGELSLSGKIKYLNDKSNFWEWKRELYAIHWVVYAKDPFGNPGTVLEYLGRYTHRIAISNYRVLEMDEQNVTFSFLNRKTNKKEKLTLTGAQFICRFLMHVLPKGFRKIRHFGIFATRVKTVMLDPLRRLFNMPRGERPKYTVRDVLLVTKGVDMHLCDSCGGVVVTIAETPRPRGSPVPAKTG